MSMAGPLRQAALMTLGAGAVLAAFFLLPAGPALAPIDFLGDEHAVLQFCDPFNSRPLPGIAGKPPVTLALAPDARAEGVFTLTTISGKPVGPADVMPRGHPEVRFTITDPAGVIGRPVDARPGTNPGEWIVAFAPRRPGTYHLAATFTPFATGKEITAKSDLTVNF